MAKEVNNADEMKSYEAYIFDLDGTVYLGNSLLAGAGAAIRICRVER